MSELPRRIVSRLRRFIGNRRRNRRAQVRLNFTLRLSDPRTTSNGSRRIPSIDGHTLDISANGMALIVPAIRIGEHYLAGDDRRLHVSLKLPDGPVELTVAPVRYESLEEDQGDIGYLIGTRIVDMNSPDRNRFEDYVATILATQNAS